MRKMRVSERNESLLSNCRARAFYLKFTLFIALMLSVMANAQTKRDMLIRISEIEVYPEYLDEYLNFAKDVGATSVKEEPGVVCIYPMVQQRDSCQIRILEIYRDRDAYKSHIQSAHFQTYKQGTLHMVKSLDLVDMYPLNPGRMNEIFLKLNEQK